MRAALERGQPRCPDRHDQLATGPTGRTGPRRHAQNRRLGTHIALDAETATTLRAHRQRQRQLQERLTLGEAWKDTGFVFTQPDGDRLHPQHVTEQFLWLAYLAGLPPIRLHDLRHGAASLMLAAGVEMKVVQETLGHTSSSFTADTYTSVFPEVAMAAAEKTAALLLAEEEDQEEPGEVIPLRA
ncbi:tyrosine-type recombinase/integrase [Nonomuraea angiospora]|uniref:tyrosine-type recombinase/integrase n=1 Tax=Nonomuraea angiospora TaxID=46172 RepID=UPI00344916E1